mgnify:CR=1 FL=1
MESAKLVSVIMTCHNGEKYIGTAIDSVMKQTYKNWQLIFYNNFSNDKSLKIVESYQDERIKCFNSDHLLNLGQVRKLAIEVCSGEYVCFLDVDDYWNENKIEKQILKFQENKNIDLVYSNYFLLKEEIESKKIKNLYKGVCSKNLIESYIDGNPLSAWLTVMIKMECVNKLEYSFDENLHIASDMDFFIRLSKFCNIDYIEDYLAYYRIHEDNESKEKSTEIEELAYICTKYEKDNELKFFLNYKNFSDKIFIKNYLFNKISKDLKMSYRKNIKSFLYKVIFLSIYKIPQKLLQKIYKCFY